MSLVNDINVRIGATDATGVAFRSAEIKMKSLAGAAKSVAGALGLAFSAQAVISFTKSVIDYGSALNDAATATNTNVEALQVFRYAAELGGAKAEQMDKALIMLNKSAVDASNGSKSAADAFRYLNINADTFIGLPTEQKLSLLAQKMSQATDENRAASAAMDLMGSKNAPKLTGVLKELGENGYGSLESAARRANAVINELDIKKLDEAGDGILKFQRGLMVKAAPIVGFWGDVMLNGWDKAVDTVMDGNKKAVDSIKKADATVTGIGAPDYSAFNSFYKAGAAYSAYKDRLIASDRSKDATRLKLGMDPIDRSWIDSVRSFGDVWEQQMDASVTRTAKDFGIIRGDMTATQVHWASVAKGIEGYTSTMASNMTTAIMEFAETGKLNFKSFANSVIQDMVRILITESITRPMAGAFTGFISTGIGAMFGGAADTGGSFGGGGSAAGGPISSGRSYLVGEKGPEIMTTKSDGRIIPNDQLGGGGSTIINFNVTAMDSASFSTHLAKHKGEISGIVENAYKRRGKRGPMTS